MTTMPRSLQLLLLFCLLSPGLCGSSAPEAKRHQELGGVERVRRSGEGTTHYGRLLMTVVQQQSYRIGRLESDLTAYKTQVQGELTAYKAQVTSMNSQLQQVQRKMENASKPVFFTARIKTTTYTVTMGRNSPVIFNSVVTNIGDGYNRHTGIFTAPVAGIYVFYAQLMKHGTTKYIHWGIYTSGSGTAICNNSLDEPNRYDKSSCLATVRLQKGDTVMVKKTNDYNSPGFTLEGLPWCSFSGFLSSVGE